MWQEEVEEMLWSPCSSPISSPDTSLGLWVRVHAPAREVSAAQAPCASGSLLLHTCPSSSCLCTFAQLVWCQLEWQQLEQTPCMPREAGGSWRERVLGRGAGGLGLAVGGPWKGDGKRAYCPGPWAVADSEANAYVGFPPSLMLHTVLNIQRS